MDKPKLDECLAPGWMLAAWPDLMDENFMHRVLLMCRHTSHGAFGLILNHPMEAGTDTLLSSHPILGKLNFPIFKGGPVDAGTLQYVHRVPGDIPGAQQVSDDLWMGGDFEALARFIERRPEEAQGFVRLFLGYAGWSGGQLEAEVAEGSWIPAPPDADEVFHADPEGAWRRVLCSLGDVGRGLAGLPPDPEWN